MFNVKFRPKLMESVHNSFVSSNISRKICQESLVYTSLKVTHKTCIVMSLVVKGATFWFLQILQLIVGNLISILEKIWTVVLTIEIIPLVSNFPNAAEYDLNL